MVDFNCLSETLMSRGIAVQGCETFEKSKFLSKIFVSS